MATALDEHACWHAIGQLKQRGVRFTLAGRHVTVTQRGGGRLSPTLETFVRENLSTIKAVLGNEARLDLAKLETRRRGLLAGFWQS